MSTMECVDLRNEGLALFAALHRPDGPGPFPAVLFCHGFTGQCLEPGWTFVRVARRLAEQGIMSLRFDYRFSGQSEGEFRDMTISGEVSDALKAMEMLESRPEVDRERLGLLGFSMGGTVAAETAERHGRVKTLCLWAPVFDPPVQFSRHAEQMGESDTLDLGPVVLGRGFVRDLCNHDPLEAARRWGGPLRVIHGEEDQTVDPRGSRAYLDGPGRRDYVAIPGADHIWTGAEVQARLFDATVQWFLETL